MDGGEDKSHPGDYCIGCYYDTKAWLHRQRVANLTVFPKTEWFWFTIARSVLRDADINMIHLRSMVTFSRIYVRTDSINTKKETLKIKILLAPATTTASQLLLYMNPTSPRFSLSLDKPISLLLPN